MEFIAIKTRRLEPPQDNLFVVLDEYLTELREGDVVLVSSKVVAIHEGRCVTKENFNRTDHIQREAQLVIPRQNGKSPLTVINNVFVSGAGVDQSNSNGYYTLLPKAPFVSAQSIHQYLRQRFAIHDVGVIITDSRSTLCRYGAEGVAIGFWGLHPLVNHIGKEDLFGRKIKHERSNLVDGLAAGGVVLMGEVAESTPIVIVRDVPNVTFTESDCREELFCPFDDDILRVLYERFLT